MGKVFLFGAGASCEYRGVYGGLFVDGKFFEALEEMWERWLRGGNGIPLEPWNPASATTPGGAQHYDGGRWQLPDLQAVLTRVYGPDYRRLGLEPTFSAVAEAGTAAELDLYIRAIELTIFHKLRALEPENVATHVALLRQQLSPGDTIVTFNYDPVIEIALRQLSKEGPVYWHEVDGYSLGFRELGPEGDPPTQPSNIEVLKLHGSLNWLAPVDGRPSPPFRLLRILPNSLRGPGQVVHRDEEGTALRPVIVPPFPDKDYEALGLTSLWDRARSALSSATALLVAGYRLPATDRAALELLTEAAARMGPNVPVTYVTLGDEPAAQRFQQVFPQAAIHLDGLRAYTAIP